MKELFFIDNNRKIFLFFSLIILTLMIFPIEIVAQDLTEVANWQKLYTHSLYTATIFQVLNTNDIPDDLKNYILGTCYYFIGKYDLAEFYLKKISSHFFKYIHDPVAYYLGIISFFKNEFLISATFFNEIASFYEDLEESGKFIYYFSLSLIEIGKTDLALKYLKIGLDSNYSYYKQYYSFTIAKVYYNLQDFVRAAAEFENFLFNYSDSSLADDTLYYLGRSYYNLKDYKNAKRAFSSIINLYRLSEYYYSSLYYLGQITGNKIYYEEIISKNPAFNLIDYVYYEIAKLSYDEANYEKAYQYFLEAFNKTENQSIKYNCIVFILKIKGDIPKSYIEKLNSELRKPILLYILSNYFYFKQFEKIFDYENSIFSNEILSNPDTLIILGKAYLEIKDIKKSLSIFLEALKLDPSNYKLYFFIAYCYYKLEDYENAQKLFSRVIYENNIESYYGYYSYLYLGIIELKKMNFKISQQYFEQILLKYPTYKSIAEVYYFISIVYYNLHDYRKALSAIEFSYSSNITGDLRLAVISQYIIISMRFDFQKTQQLFNEYENLNNDKEKIFSISMKIAEYTFSSARYDLAENYYKKALDYCENERQKLDIILQIITIYYNRKDYDKAYNQLERLLNNEDEYRKKDILFLYLNTAVQIKKTDAAYQLFQIDESNFSDFVIFVNQFISLFTEKEMYSEAIRFIDKIISTYKTLNESILFDLRLTKASIYYQEKEIESALNEYLYLYEKYSNKQKDLELYIVDCALRLKNFDLLTEKIQTLLSYNEGIYTDNSFYLILKMYFLNKIDYNFIMNLKNNDLIKTDNNKFDLFLIYINNKSNLKKQTELFKPYLSSKNSEIAFWARFFYSVALYDSKDYKNSKLLLESLITVSNDFQKEFIYYFLYIIEKVDGKESKYWDLLSKEYPFTIFI